MFFPLSSQPIFAQTLLWMNQDEEHLNLLSIFHYVVGGFASFFGLFPLIYVGFGSLFIFAAHPNWNGPNQAPPPSWLGVIIIIIGGLLFLGAQAIAASLILAGRFISKRTHYSFIFVLACVQCVFFPFGTALGIFTIIVLVRPSVKDLFGLTSPKSRPQEPPPL